MPTIRPPLISSLKLEIAINRDIVAILGANPSLDARRELVALLLLLAEEQQSHIHREQRAALVQRQQAALTTFRLHTPKAPERNNP